MGCEVGLFLAEVGRDVTIIEMTGDIGDPVYWRHTIPLVMKMDTTPNLKYMTNQECTEITSGGIRIRNGDAEDFIEADSVIISAGMMPDRNVVEELRDSARNFFPVGDCVSPQNIMQAMQGGYYAALDIL